jgi:hypothetical protein
MTLTSNCRLTIGRVNQTASPKTKGEAALLTTHHSSELVA